MSKFFKKTLSFLGLDEDDDDYDREDFSDGEADGSVTLMKDKGRMGEKYQKNSFIIRFKSIRWRC